MLRSLGRHEEAEVADEVTFEEHTASSLIHDERVQRALRPGRVREIEADLDLDSIGVITCSRREDGRLVILDGQHRVLALIARGMGDWPVTCRVFHGLTLAEEAMKFVRLNNTSKTTAVEALIKKIVGEDPEALAINVIVKRNGLSIAASKRDGTIACATTLLNLYRKDKFGPAALGFALTVSTAAWGHVRAAAEGPIIEGLGIVYLTYGEEVDRAALIGRLAKYAGGPAALRGNARGLVHIQGRTMSRAVAEIVVNSYNVRRRSGQLPPL